MRECWYCQEPVREHDRYVPYVTGTVAHYACAMRSVIGSVAHLEGRCSCCIKGATEGDPSGMTRRQAAKAALAVWTRQDRAERLLPFFATVRRRLRTEEPPHAEDTLPT